MSNRVMASRCADSLPSHHLATAGSGRPGLAFPAAGTHTSDQVGLPGHRRFHPAMTRRRGPATTRRLAPAVTGRVAQSVTGWAAPVLTSRAVAVQPAKQVRRREPRRAGVVPGELGPPKLLMARARVAAPEERGRVLQ